MHVVTLPVANQHLQLYDVNENVNPEQFWTIANDSSAINKEESETNLGLLNHSDTFSLVLPKCIKIGKIIYICRDRIFKMKMIMLTNLAVVKLRVVLLFLKIF